MAVASTKTRQVELAGGKEISFPVYYKGQNANGVPDHFISRDEALSHKRAGRAQSIHRGKAILMNGPMKQHDSRPVRDIQGRRWAVINQTVKGGACGPGMPRWGLQ
jgi:hypothetical protein